MESRFLNYSQQSRIKILSLSSLCFAVLLPVLALINTVLDQEYSLALIQLTCSVFCGFVYYCSRQRRDNHRIVFAYAYVTIALSCATTMLSPLSTGAVAWSLLSPVLLYALLGEQRGFIATLVSLSLHLALLIEMVFPNKIWASSVIMNVGLCFIAIWVLTHAYERNREQAELTLHNLATKDALTGCLNRLALIHNYESLRQEHSSHPMSMLILDIDFFKAINDEHGHSCGDRVLQEMGQVLTTLTNTDIYRIGGEEFCLLLPREDLGQAARLAEALRNEIDQHQFLSGTKNLHLTLSIGVCACEEHELSKVLMMADVELYRAKQSGRNQIKVCSDEGHTITAAHV
ncbi:GGDEF domain-containing protein [Vibrio agarivorans]|uniref:GGDEF domain-containing protein n=1 Tax=Vibrio agarivorans TaxID=153622 RepID=UPI0022305F85|nr:GGDEF domain-containing protein [Vibrio agarivorans]MDN3663058.1 GGDEF domain-containing protein [Vibrio agarivorans]